MFASFSPVCEVAGSKVGGIMVSLGFCFRKLIGNISEPQHLRTGDTQGADVLALVVDHGEKFTHMLDWFSLEFVLRKQSCRCPFVAVQDQIDEVLS